MAEAFVGRLAELGAIRRAIETADAGATTVVLVGGEPGQGKSRLLEEAAAQSSGPSDTKPLWIRGSELERTIRIPAPPQAGAGTARR